MNETFEYVQLFARFPLALHRFLRHTVTLDDARRTIRDRLQTRDARFLQLVERGVYAHPHSPYLRLLKHAGCEMGDLRALVTQNGVESALRTLREQGVYVTFEELRGRRPIVRNGLTLTVAPRDFDNPLARRDFAIATGGSSGLAMGVNQNLDLLADETPFRRLMLEAHGMFGHPIVLWGHVLPGASMRGLFMYSRMGLRVDAWFAPRPWRDSKHWMNYGLAATYMLACLRAAGTGAPFPRVVTLDRADVVARHLRRLLDVHPRCLLFSGVSTALRVCLAAKDLGIDLTGCALLVAGEPVTAAKARQMRESGAIIIPTYGVVEAGMVGYGCANPADVTDVHLQTDALAVFTHPHRVEPSGVTVPAFNVTTLFGTASKILINAQIDDYGVVEERACGCAFDANGYHTHIRQIRSYSKLVGEGITLMGGEIVQILEEVLPARFGGSPLDYQLLEEEDERGFTRLSLVISPRVQIGSEQEVVAIMHAALRRSSAAGDMVRSVWQAADAIQVKRQEPAVTATGKVLPLHIPRRVAERA
jgi:hypothetical protein